MFQTALKAGEIITRVSFPLPSKAAYMKFRQPDLGVFQWTGWV
jgi:carbon-monoxide dehydrogenase medium subunit